MKKTILLGAAVLFSTAAFAQESRQDASISFLGTFTPTVNGNGLTQRTTLTGGALVSYRYLLTPHSGLELNYSFSQNTQYFSGGSYTRTQLPIHTRNQELTAAYVYTLNFKRYNPFVEGGVGGILFTPIQEGSYTLDAKQKANIGGLFGGGLAYELSPSFDIRVQYRGMIVKAPGFGIDALNTGRYVVVSTPAVGIAYHF